ncbi:MAG: phospho-N-acetylmuramoyl-pentapeptide-transferase, partial [Bacteriovoracaceae bacterium]|nr:phospho-N-acetylmuramoyl-pentapeptide-transferase [Bacteriovoracaceae bacterium]
MFYHWLYPLSQEYSLFNVFKYITFRSFLAFVIAAVASIVWGKRFIAFMKLKQFGQSIREDGPQSHLKKAGTPTLGGVFIVGSVLLAVLLNGNFLSLPFVISLLVMLSYFLLGWLDDYLKIIKKNSDGVSAKGKLLWQFSTAILASSAMISFDVIDTQLYVPFLKGPLFDMGWFYVVFASVVIVGSSNAVNLTDGLDGLVTGPILTSAATL